MHYDKLLCDNRSEVIFASCECVIRGLDPFKTNFVVADPSRGGGAICLAVTPAMKVLGVKNRCRVYEIPKNINYYTAPPRMRLYMQYSAEIYSIFCKFISPDDIHPYSIDECFLDFTPYIGTYHKTPKELAVMIMDEVYDRTGICATAGIGTNLFLAKVALCDLEDEECKSISFFTDTEAEDREERCQRAIIEIKNRYGKNAILRGISYEDKATARTRNNLIGGHHA